MNSYQANLIREIIAISEGKTWADAKLEWRLHEVIDSKEPHTCLCGHFPITELCVIKNQRNQSTTTVGNVCVKKFLGLPSGLIFDAIRRIQADITKSLNAEALDYARQHGWLDAWQLDVFYPSVMRKRNLSERQMEKKVEANQRFLRNLRRR